MYDLTGFEEPIKMEEVKKIINNKKYDTKTAKLLNTCSDIDEDELWNITIRFYQKKNGEFFLYGDGYCDPDSYYPCRRKYPWIWNGQKILPLTEEQARMWAEKHLNVDEYEAIFGEVEE